MNNNLMAKLSNGVFCRKFEEEQIIGHYRILKELGRGATGIVYKAEDKNFNGERVVAIKVLPQHLSQLPEVREDFKREFITASKLVHQNICAMYEFGEDREADTYFLVIEYLEGKTLEDLVKEKGRFSLKEAIPIIEQICTGLSFAHSKNILHLDMKPGNIMVMPFGEVKIMDFGLAQQLRPGTSHLNLPKIFGTPLYIAPEQIRPGKGNIVRHATDIWALGVIVYEILAGKPPFKGNNIIQLSNSIINTTPKPIEGLSNFAWQAILRALAKKPQHRFLKAQDFFKALKSTSPQKVDTYLNKNQKKKSSKKLEKKEPKKISKKYLALLKIFFLIFLVSILSVLLLFSPPWIRQKNHSKNSNLNKIQLPKSLIKTCWNPQKSLWDFTTKEWLILSIEEKQKYSKAYQKWYAKKFNFNTVQKFNVNNVDFVMCLIPPGCFWMGSSESEPYRYQEEIRHKVTITEPY